MDLKKDKDKNQLSLFNKHIYEGAGFYSHFKTNKNGAIEPFYVYRNGLYTEACSGENREKTHTYGARAYDAEYKWQYNKVLEFQAIYAYFNAGDAIKEVAISAPTEVQPNNAQRLFLQLDYKFNMGL